jgi:PAS domain S-box-containing protein
MQNPSTPQARRPLPSAATLIGAICVVAVAALYLLAFSGLHDRLGDAAGMLCLVPVAVGGILLGIRGGMIVAVLAVVLNAFLLFRHGVAPWPGLQRDWPTVLVILAGGPGSGALRTLIERATSHAAPRSREGSLERSLSLLQATLESTDDGVLVVDRAGVVRLHNQRFAELWRIPGDVMAPRDHNRWLRDALGQVGDGAAFLARVQEFQEHPEREGLDVIELKDGRIFERCSKPQRLGEEIVGRVWNFREITEQRRTEEALRRTQFAVDHAVEMVSWVSEDGRYRSVNEATCLMLGYAREELLRLSVWDIDPDVPPGNLRERWQLLAEVGPGAFEARCRRKDGTVFPVEITASFVEFGGLKYACAFARDITARLALEEQLRQVQKLEAVGRLAGGVAHDFNNLLNVIMGHSDLVLRRLPPSDPARSRLEQIQKAANRAASLTGQLLAFSRKQVLEPKVVDIGAIAEDMVRMLRTLVGENIEVTVARAPGLGLVRADPGQIEQVLLNLAVNARDAMPDGGRLLIEFSDVELDESHSRPERPDLADRPAPPGRYVMLAVTDTGAGMDRETVSHIFEPFFTTKERGKGTGLGLATVYGIVCQSGGYIGVYSETGHGSVFKIYLPRLEETAEVAQAEGAVPVPRGAGETILLAEDEESLRTLTREMLEASGYVVLAGASGAEALRIAGAHGGPIHALVTDVIMPGMTGPELADQLTAKHPETRVLYISGYTHDAIAHHGVLKSGIRLVSKPFSQDELARRVAETLLGHPGAPDRRDAGLAQEVVPDAGGPEIDITSGS